MARILGVTLALHKFMNWRKPDTIGQIVFWSAVHNHRTYEFNLRTVARALEAQRLILAKIEREQQGGGQ